MAKQIGPIKIKGKIGDLTFYETKQGAGVRLKGGPTAKQIAEGDNFVRTRENNAEFSVAANAAKLLRQTLRGLLIYNADNTLLNRLTGMLLKVVKADGLGKRGERQIRTENLRLLRNLNFNSEAILSNVFFETFTVEVNRSESKAAIRIPAFGTDWAIAKPPKATHFNFVACAAAMDFDGEGSNMVMTETDYLPLFGKISGQTLELLSINACNLPVFVVLGIRFFQEMQGVKNLINEGKTNSFAVIEVDIGSV